LLGGRYFSALGLEYFFGAQWQDRSGPLLWSATTVSAMGLVALWLGLAVAARRLTQPADPRAGAAARPAEHDLAALAATTLALQLLLHVVARTGDEPHYLNGTWFCVFALVWLAYSAISRAAWRRTLAGAHALALVIVVVALLRDVHARQGSTGLHVGPTLGTQLACSTRSAATARRARSSTRPSSTRPSRRPSSCCRTSIPCSQTRRAPRAAPHPTSRARHRRGPPGRGGRGARTPK
jgi:hypothetical protein